MNIRRTLSVNAATAPEGGSSDWQSGASEQVGGALPPSFVAAAIDLCTICDRSALAFAEAALSARIMVALPEIVARATAPFAEAALSARIMVALPEIVARATAPILTRDGEKR